MFLEGGGREGSSESVTHTVAGRHACALDLSTLSMGRCLCGEEESQVVHSFGTLLPKVLTCE